MAQPSDRDCLYILHMLDTAREALATAHRSERAVYDQDRNLRLALAHLVQIIGEAARHVSLDFQNARADIEWAAIIGMRNRIVHDYLNVDEDIVWTTVTQEFPVLIEQLEQLGRPGT